jgi:hypothetical protein
MANNNSPRPPSIHPGPGGNWPGNNPLHLGGILESRSVVQENKLIKY